MTMKVDRRVALLSALFVTVDAHAPDDVSRERTVLTSAQYSEFEWNDLPARAQSYARLLGYEEDTWDEDDHIPAYDLEALSPEQVAAATYLGIEDYFLHFGFGISWANAKYVQIKNQCASETFFSTENINVERPIPDENDWKMLRDMYIETVGVEKSSLDSNKKTGLLIPYRVGRANVGGGRAVYATEDVPAGTHVRNGTGLLGFFEDIVQYVQFLTSFGKADTVKELGWNWTCDMVMWSYEDEDHWTVDLEDGALKNADNTRPNLAWPKSGCSSESGGPKTVDQIRYCKDNLFAARDIRKGEELRMSYDDWPEYSKATD